MQSGFPFPQAKEEDAESTSSKSSNRSLKSKRSAASVELDTETEHPLKTLAKAARLMNPAQFDVGKEISCSKPLPGKNYICMKKLFIFQNKVH